jgi:3-oxoacyl-[acyl-carrier-protein] synthase-3
MYTADTSETYSKHLHPRDKGTVQFLVMPLRNSCLTEVLPKLETFHLELMDVGQKIDCEESAMLQLTPRILVFDESSNPKSSDFLFMKGGEIFNFTSEPCRFWLKMS